MQNNDKRGQPAGDDAVSIDHPASAETDPRSDDLPTNTPNVKQGPNTFSGEEAKDWSRRNPGA